MDAVNDWISKNCRFAMSQEEARRVLQVEPDADMEAIRSAYRRLTLKYHPDKCPTSECQEEIRRINNAHDVLRGKSTGRPDKYGPNSGYGDFVREYAPKDFWSKILAELKHDLTRFINISIKGTIETCKSDPGGYLVYVDDYAPPIWSLETMRSKFPEFSKKIVDGFMPDWLEDQLQQLLYKDLFDLTMRNFESMMTEGNEALPRPQPQSKKAPPRWDNSETMNAYYEKRRREKERTKSKMP